METPRTQAENPSALPPGTRLGEFELRGLLGVGGFGIVYLAFDHALEREVAVKEYMPASLAGRTETMQVSLRSQSDADTFALGLKSFVNEARLLARFDHPSLLKVHRFWEANGTAYMAMPVMRGHTVREERQGMIGPPDEAWLRALLNPLLGAIEKLHSEGVYHRDIAPDNIQIEPGGHPVLLDFGAARRVISDKTQTLTAILKPAYAPIEQYAETGSVKQGPWTDIYALGATLHYLLLGRPPAPATTRTVHDDASALTAESLPGCSDEFLRTIEWMLAPRPADRPQSVASLREVLEGRARAPRAPAAPAPAAESWERTVVLPSQAPAATTVLMSPPAAGAAERGPGQMQPADSAPLQFDSDRTVLLPKGGAPRQQVAQGLVSEPAFSPAPPPPPQPHAAAPQRLAPMPPPEALAPRPTAKPRSKVLPVLLGLGVAAAVAAGVTLWQRPTAAPETQVTPPSAALPAPVAPAQPVAQAPVPATAASAVATVPQAVDSQLAAAPAAPASAPAVPESAVASVVAAGLALKPPTVAAQKPPASRPAAQRPAPPSARVAQATPAAATPVAAAPQPEPTPAATPAPVVPAAAPPAQPVPEPAAPVVVAPEAKCGGRNPLRYFVCMERECLRSELANHADCQKWRKNAKRD